MKGSISIHRYLIYFILVSLTLPMIVLSITNGLLIFESLKKEYMQEDSIKVALLSNSIRDYIRNPIMELNLVKDYMNAGLNTNEDDFNRWLQILANNNEDIFRIEISDLVGEIRYYYPPDKTLIGTDISGYEYFKKSIVDKNPYWSSTFLSRYTHSSAVTLSEPYDNGVITLFISINRIENVINILEQEQTKRLIFVTDQKGVYVYHPNNEKVILREREYPLNNEDVIMEYEGEQYYTSRLQMPETGWHITLYTPVEYVYGSLTRLIPSLLISLLIIISIAIFIGNKFSNKIFNGINILLKSTRSISEGEYHIPIEYIGIDELNQLGWSIVDMSHGIYTRETELKRAKDEISNHKVILENEVEIQTRELRVAIDSLNKAQETIIESEKMASLGEMVAGIAHEINTPVGIIVTAASYLQERTEDILDAYKNNTLKKNIFADYCENIITTTSLILSNSKRSSNLISSFKQVAVDQTSDDLRKIKIEDYINEIVTSLNPHFKKNRYKIVVECEQNYYVETYPGAIAQIITNFILNSIKHGFEDLKDGIIRLTVSKNNNLLKIIYSDDGHGMSPENTKKIYDPFFTTKRSTGGSGLGMHIVYNLVTQKLNGTITCKSKKGEGTAFELNFPVRIV